MIGGMNIWFGNLQDSPQVATVYKHKHSPGCDLVGGQEWRPLLDYDMVDQDYIMECKHSSHDAVHFLFKHWLDSPISETIPEGRLF